jgi:hypothetical protein
MGSMSPVQELGDMMSPGKQAHCNASGYRDLAQNDATQRSNWSVETIAPWLRRRRPAWMFLVEPGVPAQGARAHPSAADDFPQGVASSDPDEHSQGDGQTFARTRGAHAIAWNPGVGTIELHARAQLGDEAMPCPSCHRGPTRAKRRLRFLVPLHRILGAWHQRAR